MGFRHLDYPVNAEVTRLGPAAKSGHSRVTPVAKQTAVALDSAAAICWSNVL